jgi:hypothetical protein
MSAQTILVVSKDKDFSAVVAEQAKLELGLSAIVAENNAAAQVSATPVAAIVTSEGDIPDAPYPVITVNPPVRLQQLLEDISVQLVKKPEGTMVLKRGYSLQLRQKQLMHASGGGVDLTDKETQLLQTVAAAGDKGMGKDQLLKEVWGIEAALDTHTLETHIYRLRGKCKELAGDELIEAMDGRYVLK